MIKLTEILNEMGPNDLHYQTLLKYYEEGDDEMKSKIVDTIAQVSMTKHKETNIDTIKADLSGMLKPDIIDLEKLLGIDPFKMDEALNENEVDYYIDRDGNEFQTIDVNYLQYPGNVTVKYVGSSDPVEYKGNFEADLKSGIIKRLGSKINEAFFIGENQTIECEKCGWEWKLDAGGTDPYVCHKCGYDNSNEIDEAFYEPHDPDSEEGPLGNMSDWRKKPMEEDIDEYDVENVDDMKEFLQFMKEYKQSLAEAQCDCVYEAEYRGRKVSLGKPMQGDIKKFKVYVKNNKGKRMNIKKNNPVRRKAYRARHHCDNPGPRTKANYWSCRKW